MAEESYLRKQSYLKHGCNAFESKRPISTPLGFWTQQDILEYIYVNKLPISSIYGDVVLKNGVYKTTGVNRSGCIYCLYGIQNEGNPNRIQKLKQTHPIQYEYCLNKLGLKEVLEYMNIDYK